MTKAPNFALNDSKGNLVQLSSFLGKKTVVLFFYPKDNTSGCTAEACSFRDNYVGFKAYQAEILGISSDSEASHQDFGAKHNLPFPLLADTNGAVAKQYGLKAKLFGLIKDRATFVIDRDGIIRLAFSSQLMPHRHIDEALRAVQQLPAE
ncbi:MAG: peroxiredoxin [Myxococcota bacterium]